MIREIPIKEIPSNHSKNGVLTRIPFVKSTQKLSPYNIISTNYYLQIVVFILYFVKIPEFPVSISLPNGIKLAELPFLPMVHALKDLFDFHRAVVDDNSIVSQIQVRGLLPDAVKVVEELDKSNKIDPFLKKLFIAPQPRPNQSNLNDLEEQAFQELFQIFDATYVVGSGKPWLASHLIISKVNQNFLDSCITFF